MNIGKVDAEQPTVSYSKYTFTDVVGTVASGRIHFESGSVALEINDWTGVLSFNGGSADPTFTMTKGSETITSTLTPPSE